MQSIKGNFADGHIYRTLFKILNFTSQTEGRTEVSHIGPRQLKKESRF